MGLENHFNDHCNPIIRCLEFLLLLPQGDGLQEWVSKAQLESWHFSIFPGDSFCPSPGPKHLLKVQVLFTWDWPLVVFSDCCPYRVGVKSDPCLSGSLQLEVSLLVFQTPLDLLGTLDKWLWGCFQAREAKRRITAFCHLSGFLPPGFWTWASTKKDVNPFWLRTTLSYSFISNKVLIEYFCHNASMSSSLPSLFTDSLKEEQELVIRGSFIHSLYLFPQ